MAGCHQAMNDYLILYVDPDAHHHFELLGHNVLIIPGTTREVYPTNYAWGTALAFRAIM